MQQMRQMRSPDAQSGEWKAVTYRPCPGKKAEKNQPSFFFCTGLDEIVKFWFDELIFTKGGALYE
jgi:hypothetical protein